MSSRRQTAAAAAALTPLPAYQAPHLPLSATEVQKLTMLMNPRSQLAKLSETIGTTVGTLGSSVYELFPDPKKGGEEKERLMDEMEQMARLLVDANKHSVDMREVLEIVINNARVAGRRDVEPVEVGKREGLFGGYEYLLERKKTEWNGTSDKDKYTNSPEYLDFRRAHWESRNQDVPLPPPRTWFQSAPDADAEDEGEDSDLEIAQERQSYNCPLTLRPFEHPVRSIDCPHAFEKAAIEDMIARSKVGGVACPTPGCKKMLTMKRLRDDPGLLRKVRRELERERRMRQEEDDSNDDGEGEDDAMDIDAYAKEKAKKKIKVEKLPERRRLTRRGKVEEEEEEEEDSADESD